MALQWLKYWLKKPKGTANIVGRDVDIVGDVIGRDKRSTTINYFPSVKEKLGPPRLAPRVRRPFVGREETFRDLLAALKIDEDSVKPPVIVALNGMAGVGKTTLAAEIASQIEEAFPDGTLWTHLDDKPNIMSKLDEWGRALGQDFSHETSPQARSDRLHSLLDQKKALIVVDDVWSHTDAEYFLRGGARCRMLITTRNKEVVDNLDLPSLPQVQCLSPTASLQLLCELVPRFRE